MLISTILSVILLLGIVGYVMNSANKVQIFPVNISDCPDYYDIDSSSNYCNANLNVWNTGLRDDCKSIDFVKGRYGRVKYITPGKSASSGLCAKKRKANQCKVSWDGITNDKSICR